MPTIRNPVVPSRKLKPRSVGRRRQALIQMIQRSFEELRGLIHRCSHKGSVREVEKQPNGVRFMCKYCGAGWKEEPPGISIKRIWRLPQKVGAE